MGVFTPSCSLEVLRAVVEDTTVLKAYPRRSKVFGEREPLLVSFKLTWSGIPLPGREVKLYIDGKYYGKQATGWDGVAGFLVLGLKPGSHTVKAVFEGDFWHNPCEAEATITVVEMKRGAMDVYVDSVRTAPDDLWKRIEDKLLSEGWGVVIYRVEADLERKRFIISMWVPTQDTRVAGAKLIPIWAIVAIIASIVAAVIATEQFIEFWYTNVVGVYQCGVCGERFTSCEALREHLITKHPDVWEKIKDEFTCLEAAPPSKEEEKWWSWMKVLGFTAMGIAGAVVAVEAIRAVRGARR